MAVRAIAQVIDVNVLMDREVFNITLSIQATDGTFYENGRSVIQLSSSTLLETAFNDALIDGVKAWVDSFHGWSIGRAAVFVPMWQRAVL